MQLQQLIYFVAVSKVLNFTKAAEQLYVSQSSLSTQIANLEEELGCQLCIRTTRSVQLTPAGRYMAEKAEELLGQLDRLPDELLRVQKGMNGRVYVGYGTGTQRFLIRAMQRMQKKYPQVQVVPKHSRDITQMLSMENSEVDAILLAAPCIRGMDWVSSVTIVASGLSVVVDGEHPLARQETVSLYQLKDENLILFPRPQIPRLYDTMVSELHSRRIEPKKYLIGADCESGFPMVGAGMGVTLIPDYMIDELPAQVKGIPLQECRSGYDLLLVYDSNTINPCIPFLEEALQIDFNQ